MDIETSKNDNNFLRIESIVTDRLPPAYKNRLYLEFFQVGLFPQISSDIIFIVTSVSG